MSVLQPTTNSRAELEIIVRRRDRKLVAQGIVPVAAEQSGARVDEPANTPRLGGILQARDVFN